MNLLDLPEDILNHIFSKYIENGKCLKTLANCFQVFSKIRRFDLSKIYQIVIEVPVQNNVPVYVRDGFCLGKMLFNDPIPIGTLSYHEEVRGHIFCLPKDTKVIEHTIFKYSTLYGCFAMNNQLPNYDIVFKKYDALCTHVLEIRKDKPFFYQAKTYVDFRNKFVAPADHSYDIKIVL